MINLTLELIMIFFYVGLIAFIVLFLVYFIVFRNKLKVFILKNYRGGFRTIHFKRVPLKQQELNIKDDKYTLETKSVIESKRGTGMLFFEEGNSVPLTFFKGLKADSKMLKNIAETKVYSRLFGRQTEKQLTMIIIVLACALVGVAVFGFYMQNQSNNRIVELMANMTGGVLIG